MYALHSRTKAEVCWRVVFSERRPPIILEFRIELDSIADAKQCLKALFRDDLRGMGMGA